MAYVMNYNISSDPRTIQLVVEEESSYYRLFGLEKKRRGEIVPHEFIPKRVVVANGVKVIPAIGGIYSNYWVVSEDGKRFFEHHAPGQCDFSEVELWRNKKSANRRAEVALDHQNDGRFYWLQILRRLEAVDWEHSGARVYEMYGQDSDTKEYGQIKRVRWPKVPLEVKHWHLEGHNLTVKKNIIGDSHIWRDNFLGAGWVGLTFVSDFLKQQIEKEKLGRLCFIPVQET